VITLMQKKKRALLLGPGWHGERLHFMATRKFQDIHARGSFYSLVSEAKCKKRGCKGIARLSRFRQVCISLPSRCPNVYYLHSPPAGRLVSSDVRNGALITETAIFFGESHPTLTKLSSYMHLRLVGQCLVPRQSIEHVCPPPTLASQFHIVVCTFASRLNYSCHSSHSVLSHIIDGQIKLGNLVERKCPTKMVIYVPVDQTLPQLRNKALVWVENAHNHPVHPKSKAGARDYQQLDSAIDAIGTSGLTVQKLLNGIMPLCCMIFFC
jgi:hypothetical protein